MKDAFYKTSEERQKQVIEAALYEFSNHSFNEASLNDIIKRAGISKGGMFKYIEDKAELYLHVIELAMEAFFENQNHHINNHPCYVTRAFNMVTKSKTFYLDEPTYFKLMIKTSIDTNSPCFDQLVMMRHTFMMEQNMKLSKDINWQQYKYPERVVKEHVSTVFQGVNIKLLSLLSGDGYYDIDSFFSELNLTRDILINGLK